MANDSRSSRKAKEEENINSKKKFVNGKASPPSVSGEADTSGLRRSARETSSRKHMTQSPLSMRKSERLENRKPTLSPAMKKSDRAEKQSTSPLRRSDRGNKYSSSSSSGSKNSGRDSASSDVKRKRETSETSLKPLTEDTSEVNKNENQDLDLAGKKRKGMNARSYKALFKSQRTKVTDADQRLDKLPPVDSSSNGDVDENTERANHVPQIDSRLSGGSDFKSLEDKDGGEYECSEMNGYKLAGECNERGFEGPIGVSEHLRVEISISREKVSCTKGQNDSLHKDGTAVSKNSGIVEGTVDDTAMLLVDPSKTDLDHSELVGSTSRQPLDGGSPNDIDSCGNSETGNKTVSSNRNVAKMDTDVNAIVDCEDTPTSKGNAISYQLSGGRTQDSDEFVASSKKRRLDYDFKKCEGLHSCETTLNKSLFGTSIPKDRGQLEPGAAVELIENANATTVLKGSGSNDQIDTDETKCFICKLAGELIVCDGKDCKRSYHHVCLDPTSDNVLTRVWHCPQCVEKKIKSGVHSVSEGIESILDCKDVEISDTKGLPKQKQYFVKYKGLAHVHNKWIPAPQLASEAPLLLKKFDRKNPIMKWNAIWNVPQRLLKRRLLMPLKQQSEYHRKHAVKSLKCHYEWLVKWCGLDYEHATWELENAPFLCSTLGQNLIRDFENRLQKSKRAATPVDKPEETVVKLSELPAGCPPGIDNNHLSSVNKLRDCWSKGQCAVVFDDQERVSKVILFILSLKNATQPFLIITTSNVLSSWENEFSRLASSIHVLVYNGKKENRESIRILEFYGEGGQIIFQVLLSSMEAIVEDAQILERIRWEAVIVDECQRANISTHFQKIKTLVTETRILLFTSPMKENVTEYQNVLAFLGSDGDVAGGTKSKTVSDDNLGRLKESLLQFIAYDCICGSPKFVEYWVPVHLSNLQLEQYCATLLSNSLALCSCSKTDPIGALRDIIVSSRKCCDHPYIVEQSLQASITKDVPVAEYLDIGIKASGKLQLLDGILSEMKKRELRVLILFQPITGSGRELISIGDILDDFIRQRFGQDSYERLDGGVIVTSKRQAALNNFNNDKGRFVFLLEYRACHSAVKLSSVDAIIIFDSELNPMNDLRALQRIRIDSQSEQITILRFYACCTVEEKILLLADHDLTPEKLQNLNKSTSEAILMWGASYLFHKLDDFHSSPNANISCEHPELNNLVEDILDLIPQDCKSQGNTNSIITRVEQTGGTYSKNIPLLGKLKFQLQDGEQPHMFWRKLLEGRSQKWKYLSASTPRQRKRVRYSEESPTKTDAGREVVAKKQKKLANNCTDAAPFKSVLEAGASGLAANCAPQHVSANRIRSTEVRKETTPADNSLYDLLKVDVSRLCQILMLSEKVNVMIERFLKYIIENHRVSREPATILQAFLISVCWIGASLIKHKIDKKESLALAKKHMEFACTEQEAISVYSKLKLLTESFLSNTQNIVEPDSSNESRRASEGTAVESLDIRVLNSVSWNLPVVQAELEERPHSKYIGDEVSKEQGQSANRETSKNEKQISVKQVDGKCEKQMLTEKHLKEIEEFDIKWRNKEKQLQNDYTENKALIRVIHSNLSVRLDKIKALDTEFATKMEEHNRQRHIDFGDLKARHLAEEIQKSAAKSSTGEGIAEKELPLHGSQKKQYSEASEYGPQSGTENVLPLCRVMQGQGPEPDGVGHTVHLSEVVPANILETPPNGTVGCTIPIEKASLLVTPNSGYVEVETTTLKKAPEALIVQPQDIGGSSDGADNSDSAGHHYLDNQIPDGNTSCTHAEEVPAERETFPNEEFVHEGSVNAGTSLLKSNKENNGGGTNGPDMPNAVRTLNDRTPGSYNGNSASMTMLLEKGSAHPVVSPASRHSNPDLELQNECTQLSSSIGVRNKDAQGNHSSSPQVDSAPVVGEQNDQAITEGQGHEPSERLHLPLSTNPQLAHSQPDLPLVSGVVDEPPFSRQNIPDNAGAPPQFVEDLADVSDSEIFLSGESLEMHHLVDTELPSARSQPEWSAVGRHEHQPFNDLHNSLQNTEVLPQVVQTTVQVPSLPGLHTALSLSIAPGSDSSSQLGSRMSTPVDPLLIELERLRKEMEQVIVFHEDMKLRLKSECEKEIQEVIAQINGKYESKRQDAEAAFLMKRKELDTNQNKVLMNKVLADAFRSKCLDIRTSGGNGMQQVAPSSFMQQLRQLSLPSPVVASSSAGQPSLSQHTTTAARPSLAVASSSAGQPSLCQQTTTAAGPSPVVASSSAGQPSISQRTQTEPRPFPVAPASSPGQPSFGQRTTAAPPLQFVNNSAALFSGSPIRPPSINPVTPAGNLRVGGEIRAPAPHIRPFRPSTSVSPSSLSSFQRVIPSQHVQSSLHAPISLPRTSSRPPSPTPPAPLLTNNEGQNQHASSSLPVTSVQNSSPPSPQFSTIHSALPSNHAPSPLPVPPPFPQASSHQPAPAVSANLSSLPSQHRSSNPPGGSSSLSQASYQPPPPSPLPTSLTNPSGVQSRERPSALPVISPSLPQSSSCPSPFSTNNSSLPSRHAPVSLQASSPSFEQDVSQQPSPAGEQLASLLPVLTPVESPQPSMPPVSTPVGAAHPSMTPVLTPEGALQPPVLPGLTPAGVPQPSVLPILTDISCLPSQQTAGSLPAATSFSQLPQVSSQTLPTPPPLPPLPPLLSNPSGLYSRSSQLESPGVSLSTPNNYNVSALELLMQIDNRAEEHHPNLLPPLTNLGSNFEPWDLSELETRAGNEHVSSCPSTVATDIVCLSDDD